MVQRRTFIKWSALGALVGIVKPSMAIDPFTNGERRMAIQPKIISSWEHFFY
jgi:hypothetical protein